MSVLAAVYIVCVAFLWRSPHIELGPKEECNQKPLQNYRVTVHVLLKDCGSLKHSLWFGGPLLRAPFSHGLALGLLESTER